MPRYQSDPIRRAVAEQIEAETARAKEAQRDGYWITYLIRDPRFPDKRGNAGIPLYVGQTNDFPGRVYGRFMRCEKEAAKKGADCIERRVADLLQLNVVATYQVLEYQPTHLTSLISETNWARRCWNAGYDLANRAELQSSGGPPINRPDALASWLLTFTVEEARADDVRMSVACDACRELLTIPLAKLPQLARATTTLGHLARTLRAEACTFCGRVGKRRVRVWAA